MDESILDSIKKVLGLSVDYTAFDADVIMHINSALSTLNQLGIGPEEGLFIQDSTATWAELLEGNQRYNLAKSYMFLRVRILFDPPNTSFLNSALNDQLRELEWRLSIHRESDHWVSPNGEVPVSVGNVIDGGDLTSD